MSPIGQSGVDLIIKRIRTLSDQKSAVTIDPIFSDEEIRDMVQRASDELYYFIVQEGVPFFSKKFDFGKSTDNALSFPEDEETNKYVSIELPSDFYKVLFLIYRENTYTSDWYLSKLLDISAKSDVQSNARRGFYIMGRSDKDELIIVPDVNFYTIKQDQYILEYIPESVPVEDLRVPKGWENYLVYQGALELGAADFNLISLWKSRADELKAKIIEWAEDRTPFGQGHIRRVQEDDLTIDDIDNDLRYYYANSLVRSYGGTLRGY